MCTWPHVSLELRHPVLPEAFKTLLAQSASTETRTSTLSPTRATNAYHSTSSRRAWQRDVHFHSSVMSWIYVLLGVQQEYILL